MDCNNLKDLEKELRDRVDLALLTDVSDVVADVMEDHIIQDVYDVYEPKMYGRRNNASGLMDMNNIVSSVEKDTLIVENNTLGSELYQKKKKTLISKNANKPIAGVIETGNGYDVHGWEYDGVPRPFIQNTREDLADHKYHVKAMKNALKKMGLEVK